MKRILILLAIVSSLTACKHDDVQWIYKAEYIYINKCSRTVTVSSYFPDYHSANDEWVEDWESFSIEPEEEYHTSFEDFDLPLSWSLTNNRDEEYTVVSNGVSEFTHYYKDNDDLYNLEKYVLVSKSERKRTYTYTFRDEDFE